MKRRHLVMIVAMAVLIPFVTVGSANAFVDPASIALVGMGIVALTVLIGESTDSEAPPNDAADLEEKRFESTPRLATTDKR